MEKQKIPLKITVVRFVRAVRNFASSEVGWKAKLMFAGLIALLFGINGMNVVNSYVGREFMTAIANRDKAEFIRQALFYIGVFAASTLVAVIARFTEERLGLLWREFLTRRAISCISPMAPTTVWMQSGELANPDQRIAEDVRAFTVTTLSFVLMLLNSSFTMVAFSGVLWSISPLLFIVAVLYAACGSSLTIALGRPLVKLNYDQLDKEANFRSGLIHVRENAEAIMLARREGRLTVRLLHRLEELVANFRQITAINRNVGFFTTGYNWLIQIIPALIVAPAFMDGKIEFGVITQSAMAFSLLVAAFSLIVTQFQSISNFAAVVARLSSLMEAIEQSQTTTGSAIEIDRGRRTSGLRTVDLAVSAEWQPCAQGLVGIDPVRDPRSAHGIEPGCEGGVVQGHRRCLDRRCRAHHSPWCRRHAFSRPAALLAAGHVAAGPGAYPARRRNFG